MVWSDGHAVPLQQFTVAVEIEALGVGGDFAQLRFGPLRLGKEVRDHGQGLLPLMSLRQFPRQTEIGMGQAGIALGRLPEEPMPSSLRPVWQHTAARLFSVGALAGSVASARRRRRSARGYSDGLDFCIDQGYAQADPPS